MKILISHLFITDMPKESKEPKEPKKSKRKGGRKVVYKDKALPYEHVLVKAPKAKRGEKQVYTTRVGEQRPFSKDELRQQELIQARAIQGQQALQAQQRQDALVNLQMEALKQRLAPQPVVIPPRTVSLAGETVTRPTYEQYIEARKILAKNPPEIKRILTEFREQEEAYNSDLDKGIFNDEAMKSLIEKENNIQKLSLEKDRATKVLNEYRKYQTGVELKADEEKLKKYEERKFAEEALKEQRFEMAQRNLERLFSERENKRLAEQRKIDEARKFQEEELQKKLSSKYVWVADPETGIMSPVRVAPQKIEPIPSEEVKQYKERQKQLKEEEEMKAEEPYGELLRQIEKRKPMETGEPYTKTPEEEITEKFQTLYQPTEEELFPPLALRKPIFERPRDEEKIQMDLEQLKLRAGGGGEPGTRRKKKEKDVPVSFAPEMEVTLPEQALVTYTPPPPVPLNPLQRPPETPYIFEAPTPPPAPVKIRKEKATLVPPAFEAEPPTPIIPSGVFPPEPPGPQAELQQQSIVPYVPTTTEELAFLAPWEEYDAQRRRRLRAIRREPGGTLGEVLPNLPPPPPTLETSTELILPYETDLSGLLTKRGPLKTARREAARSQKYHKSEEKEEEMPALVPISPPTQQIGGGFAGYTPFTSTAPTYTPGSIDFSILPPMGFSSGNIYGGGGGGEDIEFW